MEAEGIRRAEAHGEAAELIIYVLDASNRLREDQRRIAELPSDRSVVVLNKIDLGQEVNEIEGVAMSLLNADGLVDLKSTLIDKLEGERRAQLMRLSQNVIVCS